MLIVPLLLMVPAMTVILESLPMNVPVLVTSVRRAVWLFKVRMMPPPLVASVPLMIATPAVRRTSEPAPTARMVPPELSNVPPFNAPPP